MAKDSRNDFACVNLKEVARISKLPYSKVMNCIKGRYNSLTDADRARLYNVLRDEVTKSFTWLGFSYEGRPIKLKD